MWMEENNGFFNLEFRVDPPWSKVKHVSAPDRPHRFYFSAMLHGKYPGKSADD
jgi:hypothetical protein